MIVPKEMIDYLLTSDHADSSEIDFLNEFSDDCDATRILNAAKYYDVLDSSVNRQLTIHALLQDTSIWVKLKGTLVKEIYQVFDPVTGQYTTCNSLDEAKEIRDRFMQDYLESHKHMFSVAQEIETKNGDTLWNSIDIDKM